VTVSNQSFHSKGFTEDSLQTGYHFAAVQRKEFATPDKMVGAIDPGQSRYSIAAPHPHPLLHALISLVITNSCLN
jgi:hypothetical protein